MPRCVHVLACRPLATDDTALLEAIGEHRDTDAFDQLCHRYAERLRLFVAARGVDDAEAVVQEVMLTVWRRAATYDPARAAPGTWIFTIARNRAIDVVRKVRRPAPDPRDPAFVAAQGGTPDPAPDAATDRSRQLAAIRSAIADLPEEQNALLSQVYLQGSTIAEAAADLGVPLGTAKSRIRLALVRLRTQLSTPSRHG